MNKTVKNLGKGMLAMSLLITAGAGFAGCGGKPSTEAQVMTLSVNPGVEFIVDEDDKVVSVTASNEDGAYILNHFTEFTGMSAKDAALKFLELSEEYGFIVEGYTDGETFTISVSGDGAKALYDDVKAKIKNKATELGLEIGNMVKIAESKLEEMIEECYQEYSEAEIAAMDEAELLELLQQSREETEGLYTEEQRLEYYKTRARKVFESRITAINDYVEEKAAFLPQAIKDEINSLVTGDAQQAITGAYNTLDSTFDTLYATIKTKVEEYISAKQTYLDTVATYRQALESGVETAIAEAKTAMENAKAAAESLYSQIETLRQEAKADFMEAIKANIHTKDFKDFVKGINDFATQINLGAKDLHDDIKGHVDNFREEFKQGISNPWGTHGAE